MNEALLLTGARLLALEGDRWHDGADVLIRAGRIAAIVPRAPATGASAHAAELHAVGTARTLDLSGLFLIPGLVDLHTHFLLRPYTEARWDDQVLREALEMRTIRATLAARATVEAGFTTIRDLGTEGAGIADIALRDAIAAGLIPGPRIFAASRAIVATGCYGPAGLDPRWETPKGAQMATGTDEVRRAVREQVALGADWIKFYADYRRASGAPATATFTLDEARAIVDEARSAGRPVAAHATTPEGMRRAVLAGADTIEHGTTGTAEVFALMAERGTVLCPTLATSEALARSAETEGRTQAPTETDGQAETDAQAETEWPRWEMAVAAFARARTAGVTIACGSDAGVFPHGDNAREIELLASCGMSPAEALRAATVTAARVLGRDTDLGRIAPGFRADLLAVSGDPLADPAALRRPRLVISAGRVALDRLWPS